MKIKDSVKDNIVHFVNNKSNLCDKDALNFVENNKMESKQSLNTAVNSIIKLLFKNNNINKKLCSKSIFPIQALNYFSNLLKNRFSDNLKFRYLKSQFIIYSNIKLFISKFMFDFNLKNPNVELIYHNSTKPNHCQNRNLIHCNVIINDVLQNLLKQ